MTATVNTASAVEWSVASRPLAGQSVSGDLHAVIPWREGVLLAVMDGLGHGDEATTAARGAVQVLEQHAGESVDSLVQQCHRALQRTRGVVMTLVSLDTRRNTAAVIGVGNVETVIFRSDPHARPRRQSVFLRGGVVGYKLPILHVDAMAVAPGDLIVFATDGVREDFADGVNLMEPLPRMVERLIAENLRGNGSIRNICSVRTRSDGPRLIAASAWSTSRGCTTRRC
jgi:phosphoserine phosphatase RsbX